MSYLKLGWHVQAVRAHSELCEAQKRALKRTAELFPVGALVLVESSGRTFTMRVTRHGCEWHDPMTVYGVNVASGKDRRFYAGSCDKVLRVDIPEKAAKKAGAR